MWVYWIPFERGMLQVCDGGAYLNPWTILDICKTNLSLLFCSSGFSSTWSMIGLSLTIYTTGSPAWTLSLGRAECTRKGKTWAQHQMRVRSSVKCWEMERVFYLELSHWRPGAYKLLVHWQRRFALETKEMQTQTWWWSVSKLGQGQRQRTGNAINNEQDRCCQPKHLEALFKGHGTQNILSCWKALEDLGINPLTSYLAQHLPTLLELLLTDSSNFSLSHLSSADFQGGSFCNQRHSRSFGLCSALPSS